MDVLWIALGVILMLAGIAGCILPLLPGPPLCYLALLLQQLKEDSPYNSKFLWIWAGITVVVTVLDYVVPVYGTKRYGGSKYGIWGCTIGLVVGLFLGPIGIILGPFIGAMVGELIANSDSEKALKAALGSFVGFLVGILLKLIVCFVMIYYFIISFWNSDIGY
ncbi:DUF456 domain-containing protein [Chryseosolibacter indicus]|uniref:DUF456 family protein n=1 Tax=Chryseosolibacter indicus TaxID=2782351 RepID=A0ABS5VU61_9BACT|nr:DUF456 domain-containing protein [Chryseosolibacter indicus]MBT1704958.1 DUF456 family protein [Chryseosolibacter indicus]